MHELGTSTHYLSQTWPLTMKLKLLFEVGIQCSSNSRNLLSPHHLRILLIVPALRLVKGHEQEHKLPHIDQLGVQGIFPTDQQRTD